MSTSERSEASDPASRTVVLAYDGSGAARQAVKDATRILGPSRLLVVTVWEAGLAYTGAAIPADGMVVAPMVDPSAALAAERALHEHAERLSEEGVSLARAHGAEAQALPVPDDGDIAGTILAVAREYDACAIVVGSRGLSGIRARLEGSTSQGILKHAHCPVIVVHEPGPADR